MKRFIQIFLIALVGILTSTAAQAAEAVKSPPNAVTAPTQAPAPPPGAVNTTPNLDFNLLDSPATPPITTAPPVDLSTVKRRRLLLTLHQSVGIALAVAMAGSMITGQLNYNDKFLGENSGRYERIHQAFVYPTLGLAAVTAGLGIFAPVPINKKTSGFDRMTLHKIGMFTAFSGWGAELALGLLTAAHEGFANQRGFATAHLVVGYTTLAGVLLGLGAITF